MTNKSKGPQVDEYKAFMVSVDTLRLQAVMLEEQAQGFVNRLGQVFLENDERVKAAIKKRTLRPTVLARKGVSSRYILFNDLKYVYGARAPDEIELDEEPKFYWTSPEGMTHYAPSLHDALLSCICDFLNPARDTPR